MGILGKKVSYLCDEVKKKSKTLMLICFAPICKLLPIANNKVVFSSFNGTMYNGQPLLICEELKKRLGDELDIVWILKDGVDVPANVRTAKPKSFKMMYELLTARAWVDNARKYHFIKKRPGQFYIQTWHGQIALKAIEKDAQDTLPRNYIKGAKRDSKNADLIVAETAWGHQNIRDAFWYDGEILNASFKYCYDLSPEETTRNVRRKFGIAENEKILLYAPTFRKDGNTDCYLQQFDDVAEKLGEKFNAKFKTIVRLHPNVGDKKDVYAYSENLLDGTNYPSYDDLVCAADVVISDYSSCAFYAYKANKVVFLYTKDLDDYLKNDRKMYFDIRELPAPVCESHQELLDNIENFDASKYFQKVNEFIDEVGFYPADAAEKAADRIIDVMRREGK